MYVVVFCVRVEIRHWRKLADFQTFLKALKIMQFFHEKYG